MKIIDPILSGSVNSSGSLTIPRGRANQKPSSPKTGSIFLEISDSGSNLVVYNGSGSTGWQTVGEQTTPSPPLNTDIEYLLVAGGGGAAADSGGGAGGGAGGFLSSSLSSVLSGSSFTITVGGGGAGYVGGTSPAGEGTDSSIAGATISTITATGGGGAGSSQDTGTIYLGHDGGSGGGSGNGNANYTRPDGGSGTVGQGNDGGGAYSAAVNSGNNAAGGGGGAGAVGADAASGAGGNGGDGLQSSITGTSIYYAGGGAGGTRSSGTAGTGGQGGGGDANNTTDGTGQDGDANTGGGAGGSRSTPTAAGGSGVAIFAYDSGSINGVGGIVGDAGNGRKYHQFNSSDSFKVGSTSDFQIVTDSLEVHLDAGHFSSRGSSTWTDLTGNGYNATAVNSPTLNNYDYTLNGTSQEFTIDISGITWGGSATIEGWVKLDVATPANGSQTGLWTFDGSSLSQITHYPYTNGSAYFSTFRNSRLGPITLSASVTRTDWHHIAITSTSGGNWILYQNATSVYSTTADQSTIDTGTTNYIGRSIGGDGSTQDRRLDGNIGQFRLYSKALSASEILQNYNATKTNFV